MTLIYYGVQKEGINNIVIEIDKQSDEKLYSMLLDAIDTAKANTCKNMEERIVSDCLSVVKMNSKPNIDLYDDDDDF